MKTYRYTDAPLQVYGVAGFDPEIGIRRIPEELREQIPSLEFLGKRCNGARIAFRTNARKITVKTVLETLSPDVGMSLYSCQSVYVFAGPHKSARYVGLVHPSDYENKAFEAVIDKGSEELEDVMLILPRNEVIDQVEVSLPEDAIVEAPTPYTNDKPVLFYGSSITESGCPASGFNSYEMILSRHLDLDFYNFGFSGSAKGELAMADYINTLEISAFVYDYDHNAPTPAHLRETHEPFFKRIREKRPDLPILMMSRPTATNTPEEQERRDIVKATYEHAVAAGDDKVWFIDGMTLFGDKDQDLCWIDCCHPNDLGFYRMAERIEPVLSEMMSCR